MSAVVYSLPGRKRASAPRRHDSAETSRPVWETRFLGWFLGWCDRCLARSWQRQDLAQRDDRLLRDIGKTRQEAMAEAAKPFWK
jgi:uncharacterized protein YjiS (DUF1127 family)